MLVVEGTDQRWVCYRQLHAVDGLCDGDVSTVTGGHCVVQILHQLIVNLQKNRYSNSLTNG